MKTQRPVSSDIHNENNTEYKGNIKLGQKGAGADVKTSLRVKKYICIIFPFSLSLQGAAELRTRDRATTEHQTRVQRPLSSTRPPDSGGSDTKKEEEEEEERFASIQM